MIDGHVHLEKGPLSKEYVLEFVDEAVRKGITELQILDHTHRFIEFKEIYEPMYFIKPQEEWLDKCIVDSIEDYIKLIEEMKTISLPIKVSYGLEVCYTSAEEKLIRDILNKYQFDFLVGSVHAIDHIAYDSKWSKEYLWERQDVDTIYQKYYDEVFKLIESDLFSQIGHPDTIKMFDYYPSYDLTETYQKIATLCNEHHVKIENNVGCFYRYGHKDMGLSDEALKVFKDYKCQMITVSDAHYPKDVGTNIKDIWAKTMY